MTGIRQVQPGDFVATRAQDHGNVASLHDVAVVLRADRTPPSPSPAADLSNVIPFARARRTGTEPSTPPVTVTPADRPAPPPPSLSVARRIAVLVCSLAVHAGLIHAVWQEPRPLASIGIGAITVEIVGDNKVPGLAATLGDSKDTVEEVKADDKPVEQERTADVSTVKSEDKEVEAATE